MELKVNEGKNKFIKISASKCRIWAQKINFGQWFQNIKCFSYLGTVLNNENIVSIDSQ